MNARSQIKGHLPQPFTAVQSGILQRKMPSCGNHTVAGGKCNGCKDEHNVLQRKLSNNSKHSDALPIVNEVLRSSGQPLDKSTRAFFEPRFVYDFSHVRVHSDSKSAKSADAVNALAYTVNNDVVFGQGQYSPDTREGKRLLAHELSHVVQQQTGNPIQRRVAQVDESAQVTLADKQETEDLAVAVKESEAESEFMGDSGLRLFRQKKKGGKKAAPKASKLTAAEVKSLITANNNSTASTELLLCLIWKESGFDPKEKNSKSSATGLMQMTKGAVEQVNKSTPKGVHFTHSEMTDSAKNIQCGTYYLKIRTEWAKGDVTRGLEGYGTGGGYAANILECETCIKDPANTTDDCLNAIHP